MLFEDWIEGKKRIDVARDLEISVQMLWLVLMRKRRLGPEKCMRLVEISGGQVTLEEAQFPENFPKVSNG